ncbi:MAG: hypothetical protein GQ531_06725 [Sulfurovum sp.]|nr:hypothetical protein [Sulfurovum sp.]
MSTLWSSASPVLNAEFSLNFARFKYYFLLIIAIYSASLTTKQIKNLFFIMALAPLYTIVVYYLNAMGITHLYSALFFHGESKLLTHYLMNNFFILYGTLYFYIVFFDNLIKKDYKVSSLAALLTIIYFVSMFIDKPSTARLMILVFFMIMFMVPFFYVKKKYIVLILLVVLGISVVFIKNSQGIQQGIKTFSTAITEDKYVGSWGHRLGFAIVGLEIYKEHPLIGRGICDVRERTIAFAKENPKYFVGDPARHFHNGHINLLVQVGAVGYSLFLVFIFLFLRAPLYNRFNYILRSSFVVTFLLLMFGEHYLSIEQTSYFFALFIALMLLYHKQELLEREKNRETLQTH